MKRKGSNPFLPKPPKTGVPKVPAIPRWHPPEAPAGPPAQRSDQPCAKAYSTGSRDKALHIAASSELRQEAIELLNAQMWAKTARGPRQSRENLWNTIASTAGFQDPRDLTPLLLTTVTAILVQAGYRSTPAIVSQAVTSFKRKGGVWCDTLDLARQDALRAARRGIGPPQRSAPFPLHLAYSLPGTAKPWHPNGPVGPRNAIVTGCWWLLREIELPALKLNAITVESDTVSLTLPASKTDPQAKGVQRAHTCTRGSLRGATVSDEVRCAACTVLRQRATIRSLFPSCSSDWPLFPTSTGQFASKALMVQTVVTAASLLQLPSHTLSKTDKWGGHSLRRGGVQYMCSEGVDLCKVAAIARSTSNSILAYVDNSLLEQTKSVARDIAKNTIQEEQVSQPAASSDNTHIGPAPAKPYVKATRPRSKIHIICFLQPGTTRCRLWNWSASRSFTELEQPIFSKIPQTTTWLNCALAAAKL